MKNLLFTLNLLLLILACQTNVQAQECYQDITVSLDASSVALVIPGMLISDGNTSDMLVSKDSIDFSQVIGYNCDDIGEFEVFVINPNDGFACSSLVTLQDVLSPTPHCLDTLSIYGVFGSADEGILAWAINGNIDSYDNCTTDDNLRYTFGLHPDNDPLFVDSLNSSVTEIYPWELGQGSITRNIWVWDEYGNTDFCSIIIKVNQALSCNESLTVYLDESGEAIVSPEIVTGDQMPEHLEISKNGIDFFPTATFYCNEIGAATVIVRDSILGNSCLTNLTIIDNSPPQLEVKNYSHDFTDESETISITNDDIIFASSDNCSYTLDISKTTFDAYDLGHNEVLVNINDISGNSVDSIVDVYLTLNGIPYATICDPEISLGQQSTSCTREYIVASDIYAGNAIHDSSYVSIDNTTFVDTLFDFPDTIGSQFTVYVETIDGGVSSYCSSEVSLESLCTVRNPLAEILILDTIPPDISLDNLIRYGFTEEEIRPIWSEECSYTASHYDSYTTTASGFIIERTWNIKNWCNFELDTFTQNIEFRFLCNQPFFKNLEDVTLGGNPWSCDTDVCLPIPQFHDICNLEEVPYTVTSNDGQVVWDSSCNNGDGGYRFSTDGFGTFDITYHGTDCCGELAEKTISITVNEASQPNIYLAQNIVIELVNSGINGDGVATIFVPTLILNTFCYDSKIEIRRDSDNCGFPGNDTYNNDGDSHDSNDDTDDGQYVKFCSADITDIDDDGTPFGLVDVWGKVINLEDSVTIEAWTTIRVEDKQTLICNESTNILLDNNGEALLTLDMINDNSEHKEISKDGINYYSSILFNCDDIGENVIHLRDTLDYSSRCASIITVKDSKAPIPYCDTIVKIVFDSPNQNLLAKDLNKNSYDICTSSENLRYTFTDSEDAPNYIDSLNSSFIELHYLDIASSPIDLDVYVWDESGNYDYCTVMVSGVISAVLDEELKGLAIYPNPATDYMMIDASAVDVSGDINVILYDITGKQVISQSGNRIDLTSLNSGLYIYQVEIDGYKYTDKISIMK